jgi:hypothetical protein
MTYPLDLEGREAKREQLIRTATEKAIRREQRYMSSPACSGQFGLVKHEKCLAGPERCLCECHDPKRTEPHEADT